MGDSQTAGWRTRDPAGSRSEEQMLPGFGPEQPTRRKRFFRHDDGASFVVQAGAGVFVWLITVVAGFGMGRVTAPALPPDPAGVVSSVEDYQSVPRRGQEFSGQVSHLDGDRTAWLVSSTRRGFFPLTVLPVTSEGRFSTDEVWFGNGDEERLELRLVQADQFADSILDDYVDEQARIETSGEGEAWSTGLPYLPARVDTLDTVLLDVQAST